VFLRNVTYTLGNVSDTAAEETIQPGELKVLRPDAVVPKMEVLAPNSTKPEELRKSGQGDFAYKETEQVGIYQVRWDGGGRNFAVNLLDPEESNLQPRDEVTIGNTKLSAEATRGQIHDTWKWGAVGALALLLLEWALYYRRIFT
jgi:hypothetical protein